ncbi:MAG: hypothetical protein C4576_33520 [Desulfobacteraceae bacterium]|nr:MAG: hypothetical protein C4576_33520 [Desulfobacteraceae bacterium]
MSVLSILYRTGTGKEYPLELGYGVMKSDMVPVDHAATSEACKSGCNLYSRNGGCPPYAPNFEKLCGKEIIVLYVKIHTRHYPSRVLAGPYYTRWVFVETFLTSLTNKIGKRLAEDLGGCFVSSGNCHSCRPKRCAVKEGGKCRNPIARTYSLEATGVLVTSLMEQCFGIQLQWWRKQEPSYIPEYMVKVVGVTKKTEIDYGIIRNSVVQSLPDNVSFQTPERLEGTLATI